MQSVGTIGEEIRVLEDKVKALEKQIYDYMMNTPNLVSETVKSEKTKRKTGKSGVSWNRRNSLLLR